jgi:uncharacterized membrane protein YecN with MAPEG domain
MALLSIRVPLRRGALEVPFGDGGDEALATRIRAFGNFIEYVPMVLLLFALLESGGLAAARLHALGAALLAARVLHALAYRGRLKLSLPEKVGRGVAAMTTWATLVFAAGSALWMARDALLP